MAMRIIMAVCMLPVLPIMLGACWFLAGEKNGTQFGITLWKGAGDQPLRRDGGRGIGQDKGMNILTRLDCLHLSAGPLALFRAGFEAQVIDPAGGQGKHHQEGQNSQQVEGDPPRQAADLFR